MAGTNAGESERPPPPAAAAQLGDDLDRQAGAWASRSRPCTICARPSEWPRNPPHYPSLLAPTQPATWDRIG
jgi:hypothetical protein